MCETADEKRDLCNKTEEILRDPRFADFIGDKTREERLNMAGDDPELIRGMWASYMEENPLRTSEEIAAEQEGEEKEEYLPESVSSPMTSL